MTPLGPQTYKAEQVDFDEAGTKLTPGMEVEVWWADGQGQRGKLTKSPAGGLDIAILDSGRRGVRLPSGQLSVVEFKVLSLPVEYDYENAVVLRDAHGEYWGYVGLTWTHLCKPNRTEPALPSVSYAGTLQERRGDLTVVVDRLGGVHG